MNWQEACEDPALRDLPYKIELNEWGQIVMSPAFNFHGILQAALIRGMARAREDGTIIAESSIQTAKGVKVADVSWASSSFCREFGIETPLENAPEVCIEIISPSNMAKEMEEKSELYFARCAQEVWLCDEQGVLSFYNYIGAIPSSHLFPDLSRIESDYLH
jgi:Uma2 family endonuclease